MLGEYWFSWLSRYSCQWERLGGCLMQIHSALWGGGGSEVKWSEVAQSCPALCNLMDCSLSDSSVHGIFQARILEWVAISFSRRTSWPRDRTRVSCIVGRCFTVWATREVLVGARVVAYRRGQSKGLWGASHIVILLFSHNPCWYNKI